MINKPESFLWIRIIRLIFHSVFPSFLSLSLPRGSAFPDVCCSFDLLLQLKLHPRPPPPASLACCHSNTSTRTVTTPSSQPTLRPARPSITITIHSSQPGSSLSSSHQTAPLPYQPSNSSPTHTPGPRSISPTLPLTFAFDPLSLHSALSVLNLPAGDTQTITFVACFTTPHQRALGLACSPVCLLGLQMLRAFSKQQ